MSTSYCKKYALYIKTCIVNWQANPARLISVWLQPHTTDCVTLDIILTHNLIKKTDFGNTICKSNGR